MFLGIQIFRIFTAFIMIEHIHLALAGPLERGERAEGSQSHYV